MTRRVRPESAPGSDRPAPGPLPKKPRLSEIRERVRDSHRALLYRGLAYAGILGVIGVVAALVVPQLEARHTSSESPVPTGDSSAMIGTPPTAWPPGTVASPQQAPLSAGASAYAPWASRLAPIVNIPRTALQAYAFAQVRANAERPQCQLSWTLLAGIGKAESDHGRERGSTLNADGTSTPPIVGVPLTGSTTDHIPDTDRGALDGDAKYDRAIGPMQFIPGTWRTWAVDANGDGRADPFNINDAAMASARYLCASGGNLSTGQGWGAAVYAYNKSVTYVQSVYRYADLYARQSLASTGIAPTNR